MSPQERTEYAELVDAALNGDRTVDDAKVRRYQKLLLDAEQAQHPWARLVLDQAQLIGLRDDLKDHAKREAVSVVSYRGEQIGKSLRIGRRRRDEAGKQTYQQTLIHDFTWLELADWLAMVERQIGSLLVNQHLARRLMSLRDRYPDTRGPAEACALLGTTVEDYLSAVAS